MACRHEQTRRLRNCTITPLVFRQPLVLDVSRRRECSRQRAEMLSATIIVGKINRIVEEKRTAYCLLPTVLCLLVLSFTASAQSGPPGPSSPLYGARPEAGTTSTRLPSALRDGGIDPKLDPRVAW